MTKTSDFPIYRVGIDEISRPWRKISDQSTATTAVDQAYFWTAEWQTGESRATQDINAGRVQWLVGNELTDHFQALSTPPRTQRARRKS